MKRLAFILLAALALAVSSVGKAEGLLGDSTEKTHFAYHFLASGALYTGSYLFMHDVLECSKTDSFIFGAFTTLLLGFTYKYLEQMDQSQNVDFGRPMTYNAISVFIPAILLWHFNL